MTHEEVLEYVRLINTTDQEWFERLHLSDYTKICPHCEEIAHKAITVCPQCKTELVEATYSELKPYYYKLIDEERAILKDKINYDAPFNDYSDYLEELRQRKLHGTSNNSTNSWQQPAYNQPQNNPNTPKCPLCQSEKIRQISTIKRGVFGMAFGLLSTTARSQWECLNCGNKF